MSKYSPYIQRQAGDVATSDDWNRLQELIREEIRQHRHEGETGDTNRLGVLGTRLDNASLTEGAVTEEALADGAVTEQALQEEAFADWAVADDAQISETDNVLFDPVAGHDHDGVNSSPLAAGSVGTDQLANDAVTDDKLASELIDEIAEFEQLLAIPQALKVTDAPGTSGLADSYVDIVGHGFGDPSTDPDPVVRILTVQNGEYTENTAQLLEVQPGWNTNTIRVKLPDDPTGLFQVEIGGLPLNPLEFNESLVVTDAVPDNFKLDVDVNSNIQLTFSTELLAEEPAPGAQDQDPIIMALYHNELTPRALDQNLDQQGPALDLPIEIYYGDQATRLDAALSLSRDRKTVTLTHAESQLPWDTAFAIRIYGEHDNTQKPVLLSANNQEPIPGGVTEVQFTTQKKPPPAPESLKIVKIVGKGDAVVSPENVISLGNHHAAPLAIKTHAETLPSDWLVVEATDSSKTIQEIVPAIGNGETVYVTLDLRALEDGPIQILAQARNTTSGSDWTEIQGTDPRNRETVEWVPKDTKRPFLRVHPLRTPTKLDTQVMEVDVEPGSTVTVVGGARTVKERDAEFTGRLQLEVPLNPNTANYFRVSAIDAAGNRSRKYTTDREGTQLKIVHDDTVPEISVDPVRSPTRSRTITLKGRANEKVTVVATSGGRVATSTADINQPFKINFTLARNKVNRIKLVATDLAGNTSPPVVLTVRHDDQPPPLQLTNRGYSRFENVSSQNPRIVVRRTRIALGGITEPGSTVILSGHGHRVTTQAKDDGRFTIRLPFRLMPTNIHNRAEDRSWNFDLDAYDLSGNRTNQRRRVTVILEYRIPHYVHQWWFWGWHWWYWWWYWYRWYWRGSFWWYDHGRNRWVWYFAIHRHYGHWHWWWFHFGSWIRWL